MSLVGIRLAVSLLALLGAGMASQEPIPVYIPPPPEQPLPFSHKQHLALRLACATCHAMPEPGQAATLPSTGTCMTCHLQAKTESPAIQRLAAAHAAGEAIPWKRVYRLPDFVFFSHKSHTAGNAAIGCETCHGPVREMGVMQRVKDISMPACLECHKERQAPSRCDTCHEPR
jgi:hypothetical protein